MVWGDGGRWRASPVTVVVLPIVVAIAVNLATSGIDVQAWWWTPLCWAVLSVLAVAAVVSQAGQVAGPAGVDVAAAELAARLLRRYADEAARLGLRAPVPLAVRWASTERPVAAAREAVLDGPGSWQEHPLAGEVTGIASAYRDLPHGQLVVLGAAGAGKSTLALLLALGLLEDRASGGPVPVLVPLPDWVPSTEHLESFLVRRTATGRRGRAAARLLVSAGSVLPVLDGLDEMPFEHRPAALRAVAAHGAAGRPFVVTSRSLQYEQAVAVEGTVPARAAVLELRPVDLDQAIAYLGHPEPGRIRWQPVFDHLRAHPGSAVARALSTPLLVALARVAYLPASSRPADLLDQPVRSGVVATLLDGYVGAVYRDDGPPPPGGSPLRRYRPEQAQRWLASLAHLVHRGTAPELYWWELPRLVRLRIVLQLALIGGPVWAFTTWRVASTVVLACAVAATGVLRPLWRHAAPPYRPVVTRTPRWRWWQRRALAAGAGLGFGLLTTLVTGLGAAGVPAALACGAVGAVLPVWPGSAARQDRRSTVLGAVVAGAQFGLATGPVFAAVEPGGSMWGTALAAVAVHGGAAALCAGLWTWVRYRTSLALLVVGRQVPPRFAAFVRDAHRRGVLRRAEPAWQFRHALLQNHLSGGRVRRALAVGVELGNRRAESRLADLLAEAGLVDELQELADAGHAYSGRVLAEVLLGHGAKDRALPLLRRLVAADPEHTYWDTSRALAELLIERGEIEEALTILWALRENRDSTSTRLLVEVLVADGRYDELYGLVVEGVEAAQQAYAEMLADQGEEASLTVLADKDDRPASARLARLLVETGRQAAVEDRVRRGDVVATRFLLEWLVERGRADEAVELVAGLGADRPRWFLLDALAAAGEVPALRRMAESGDQDAQRRLDALSDEDEGTDEGADDADAADPAPATADEAGADDDATLAALRPAVDAGDKQAVERYAEILVGHGRWRQALTLLRTVHAGGSAQSMVSAALAKHGQETQLRRLVPRGFRGATRNLAQLLLDRGDTEQAYAVLRSQATLGDIDAIYVLTGLLESHGAVEEANAVISALADRVTYRDAEDYSQRLRRQLDEGDPG